MLTREVEVQSGMPFRVQRDPYSLRHPTGELFEAPQPAVKVDEDIRKDATTVINAQHNHEVKVHGTKHLEMRDLVPWALLAHMVAEAVHGVRDHLDLMEAEEDRWAVVPRLAAVGQAPAVDAPADHQVAGLDLIWGTAR